MKRYSSAFVLIAFFFIMLLFPQEIFRGASDGLLLWFQIVLPTLLPFIVISNLLIHTNSISYISRILNPLLRHLFHTSANGSFAVLAGFLCGYPMGAKVTSDLITNNLITKKEGSYLLSFCNNTSPMFITSYVVLQNLKDQSLMLPSMCILLFVPILCSFLFRFFYKTDSDRNLAASVSPVHFEFKILDTCIMNGFETITKVGGYIILFSILLALLQNIPFQSVLPLLEITNGIPLILRNCSSSTCAYVYVMALTSFGGLCSIAQTKSMIQDSGLSIFPYIIEKLITALVTSLLAFLYVKVILLR